MRLGADLRRAFRLFRLEPGFAAAAVLTLALGIGANTALFAVVEAVLLRPLPVDGADDLMILKYRALDTGITKEFIALGDLLDLRDQQRSLEQVTPYGGYQGTLYGDDEPMRVEGLGATPELLEALRVQPELGRRFNADDMRQNAPPVVMISSCPSSFRSPEVIPKAKAGPTCAVRGDIVPFATSRANSEARLNPILPSVPNPA